MKIPRSIILGLLLAVSASAQTEPTSSDAPGVAITSIRCERSVFIPALYEDPMQANQQHADLERQQKQTMKDNAIRRSQGAEPLPFPTRARGSGRKSRGGAMVNYAYQAKIKNIGNKSITSIVWQYQLIDPETEVQVGNHRFKTNVIVRVGKTAHLVGNSSNPPAAVIDASRPEKEKALKYIERVVITRLDYEDGTFWERP